MRGRLGELCFWQRVVLGTLAAVSAIFLAPGLVVAIIWTSGEPGARLALGSAAVYLGRLARAAFGLNPLSPRGRAIAPAVAAAGAMATSVVSGAPMSEPADIVLWVAGFVLLAPLVCLVPSGRWWSAALATITAVAVPIVVGLSLAGG